MDIARHQRMVAGFHHGVFSKRIELDFLIDRGLGFVFGFAVLAQWTHSHVDRIFFAASEHGAAAIRGVGFT